MTNIREFEYQITRSADGQSQTRIDDISVQDQSAVRSLQMATEQVLARVALLFKEDFIPETTFSFQPAHHISQDDTQYLLQNPVMKARLLGALKRSQEREAVQLSSVESHENPSI